MEHASSTKQWNHRIVWRSIDGAGILAVVISVFNVLLAALTNSQPPGESYRWRAAVSCVWRPVSCVSDRAAALSAVCFGRSICRQDNELLQVTESELLDRVAMRLRTFAPGPYDLDRGAVTSRGMFAAAEEAAQRLDIDQITRLERAASVVPVPRVFAIANDEPFVQARDMIYELQLVEEDLLEYSSVFFGLNAALVSLEDDFVILSTVDDYNIVACKPALMREYLPDLAAAQAEFRSFAMTQPTGIRSAALRALRTYRWNVPSIG
jgi:hypothetical protein